MPKSLKYLIGCDKGVFALSKMMKIREQGVYIIKVPKNFSIIENPNESYHVMSTVIECFLSQKVKELQLDYINCDKIDLVTGKFSIEVQKSEGFQA